MSASNHCGIYDFELFPYALGDVLTWNVQTAVQCEERGGERVDLYLCMDERHFASRYQKDLVTAENYGLLFNDLYAAFATHPRLGNIHLFRRREDLLERLRELARADAAIREALEEYERVLATRAREPGMLELVRDALAGRAPAEDPLIGYFLKYIHSHERINEFFARHGRIPLLQSSLGCGPDVEALVEKRFAGRRIVTFHVRLRRLDAGYGGEHTYARDSDFLEWYEFLRQAAETHPDVQFVAVGRLQEKPLELLRLPNVASLRTLGMGLGHELTLMLESDLFMGTSSGFAALVNFSTVPYFITRMTEQSCRAYGIPPGGERLPFATDRQVLVHEPETRELLARLLERGLEGVPPRRGDPPFSAQSVDVRGWEWERAQWLHPGATTSRFEIDDGHADKESAFLLWPKLAAARAALSAGRRDEAAALARRLQENFPRLCARFPEFLELDAALSGRPGQDLRHPASPAARLLRAWRRGYPLRMHIRRQLASVWERKHRIPGRLIKLLLGRA